MEYTTKIFLHNRCINSIVQYDLMVSFFLEAIIDYIGHTRHMRRTLCSYCARGSLRVHRLQTTV